MVTHSGQATTLTLGCKTGFFSQFMISPSARLIAAPLLFGAVVAMRCNAATEAVVSFEKDVRPILKAHCFHCHGEAGKMEGGVDLRLRRFMLKQTDDGHVMVPGKPAESLMLKLVKEQEMPKADKKLSVAEISVLEKWIASGSPTLRAEPEQVPTVFFTEEDRAYWAFQPVTKPKPLQTIDAFVVEKLHSQGLELAPEADRRTLLRRLTFDLTGLPPSPEELSAFESDPSADAYEKQVDRLLASPQYGERWGRHWLDVAGYADSNGFTEEDSQRPHAWHYRDYVIQSINADKPWNEFIREQLAGDEMIGVTHDNVLGAIHKPGNQELLTATGFLRMAPDGTGDNPTDAALAKNQVLAETLKVVSSSLLGLTVGCAQCHDHRYDPISHEDYHRLRALFEPAMDWKQWRKPNERLYSLYTDEDRKKAAEIEAQAVKMDADRQLRAKQRLDEIFEERLKKFPAEKQEWIRTARNTEAAKRSPEQQAFFKENPGINVGTHEGLLNVFDPPAEKLNIAERKKTQEFRNTRPTEHFLMALTETAKPPAQTVLFHRGDHEQPKQKVLPGELEILSNVAPKIPEKDPAHPTSGRRLAYAQWLTSGSHPLVARVLVNRFWMHHFGRGIVDTPGDFGMLGSRPTHPELLDYLAASFVEGGWKLKPLHKLIVTSAVYRQSEKNVTAQERDPENHYLARFPMKRMDAESLRDAVLVISGKLNKTPFGPAVPVARHPAGQIVTGTEDLNANSEVIAVKPLGDVEFRRSIYIEQRRTRPLTVLETFDFPGMAPNCEARTTTTVAQQSLLLLNDNFIAEQSQALAERLEREEPTDHLRRISRGWQLVFGHPPTKQETSGALIFLTNSNLDWAAWCQALLASNAFLYID